MDFKKAKILISMLVMGTLIIGCSEELRAQTVQYLSAKDHLEVNDTETALQITSSILKTNPYHEETFLLRLDILESQGNVDDIVKTIKNNVSRTKAPERLLSALKKLDLEIRVQIQLLSWAINEDYSNLEIYERYALLLNQTKQYERTLSVVTEALGTYPDRYSLRIELAEALIFVGQLHKARKELRGLIKKYPGYAEIYRLFTIMWLRLGDRSKARYYYDRFLAMEDSVTSWETLLRNHASGQVSS